MNFQRVSKLLRAKQCCVHRFNGCANQRLADIPAVFARKDIEDGVYDFWEKNNFFNPVSQDKEPLKMILPPPNVTGILHLGHAFTVTIQDVLARWYRMRGHPVVWVPGLDHAGIATQSILEKQLAKMENLSRTDLGKEKFLSKISDWKDQKGEVINKQLRDLGATLDWSKEYFTLNDAHRRATTETFLTLHQRNLVYREKHLVNWCPTLQSTISDIEVYHYYIKEKTLMEIPGYKKKVTFGQMAQLCFSVKDSEEMLIVSTTRPETVFGDVALAVNPDDDRYSSFIGRQVWHPLRKTYIPVIADSAVLGHFGTGIMKVTPAHHHTDYAIAKRHGLEMIETIDECGNITEAGGEYKGLPRFVARDKVLDFFASERRLAGLDDHKMSLQMCMRTGDMVELLQKEQWFIKCKDMADRAVQAVKDGSLKLVPSSYEEDWVNRLGNIMDWCVSRQIWWGHQIPAYGVEVGDKTEYIVARSESDARTIATEKYGPDVELRQGTDVFDTWFSSAILPLTAMGWPDNMESFNKNYPLTLMETGRDIMFLWVARMTMLGLELTNQLPFQEAILHGLLCDGNGKKMSKSVGNVITPGNVINGISLDDLIETAKESHKAGTIGTEELQRTIKANKKMFPNGIPECGTDALRMTLCSCNIKNRSSIFTLQSCISYKHFTNKIWQSCRYLLLQMEGKSFEEPKGLTLVDRWILSRLASMVDTVNDAFTNRNFHNAVFAIKTFVVFEFCDYYLEATKDGFKNNQADVVASHAYTLSKCLEVSLRILSPIAPFVTEKIYKTLSPRLPGFSPVKSLLQATYPMPEEYQSLRDPALEEGINMVMDTIEEIRRLLNSIRRKKISAVHIVLTDPDDTLHKECTSLIRQGIKINNILIHSNDYSVSEKGVCHSVSPHCALVFESEDASAMKTLKRNVAAVAQQKKSASN